MNKVLDFCKADIPDLMIEIERSDEFKNKARELGAFVSSLPLSHAENDKLVELMINQVILAEKGAFEQGAQWGALLKEINTKYSE